LQSWITVCEERQTRTRVSSIGDTLALAIACVFRVMMKTIDVRCRRELFFRSP